MPRNRGRGIFLKDIKIGHIALLLFVACIAFCGGWFARGSGGASVQVETQLAYQTQAIETAAPTPTPVPATQAPESTQEAAPVSGGKVKINTADIDTLMTLSGIGEARAKAIIADRNENGPYRIPEDITRVSGIGEGLLANIIDEITVEDAS